MDREILRGGIFFSDLSPVVGSEQGGIRPVLVIQNDMGNIHSPTVIVAAITSRKKSYLPTHCSIYDVEGLEKDSIVLLEQVRTIDKRRLVSFIGTLDEEQMEKINRALAISVGLRWEQRK